MANESNDDGLHRYYAGPLTGSSAPPRTPEFFRLPNKGGDSNFGLTRSFYYEGEKRGYWKLVRLRDRGKLRGITLVPYDAVKAHILSMQEVPS